MAGSWSQQDFPHLDDTTCEVTSPRTEAYNCIAWAAGEDSRWWWPDPQEQDFWPPTVPREENLAAFVEAYRTVGFELCFDGTLEAGIEKLAIYGTGPIGGETPTHAARQLDSGEWTSKLGVLEDIRHERLESVSGPAYGRVICYVFRPRSTPET